MTAVRQQGEIIQIHDDDYSAYWKRFEDKRLH